MIDKRIEIAECFEFLFEEAEDSYTRRRLQTIVDYIDYLQGIINSKQAEILDLQLNQSSATKPDVPLDIPRSRGTTHGELMRMHHEAETMHDNPPHDQPMG